ncbi:MAG: hypothetical protein Barrevirus2_25 [Barrevirus sp.]|uniref:Uncharacterized protein n=1 Tax=Barrevirus sp. TaxID=2487763 RepID=A0A3G4ZPP2_9VIRU|nr:MAG: hypothetical protein Barrevirus2_25 [Barrevirus sp.]
MDMNYDILFSLLLGLLIVFLFYMTLRPKYIVIDNHDK